MLTTLKQGSDAWLEERKSKIGGSDVAAILGISPYKTPLALWEEKTRRAAPEAPSYAMLMGTVHEEDIRKEYEAQTQNLAMPGVYTSEKYPWAIASVDGYTPDKIVVELKLSNKNVFAEAELGVVVPWYRCQVVHNMAVSDAKVGHFFCRCGTLTALVVVERDEDEIEDLMKQESAWYDTYIVKDVPPEMSDKDYAVSEDAEALEMGEELASGVKMINSIKKRNGALREALIQHSDQQSTIFGPIKLSKSQFASVDYKQAAIDADLDLSDYTKKSERWTARIT